MSCAYKVPLFAAMAFQCCYLNINLISLMNIAVVIAVSKYSNANNNLPASKKDGEVISGILSATKKYDKILVINNNEPSSTVKELLINFLVELKNTGKINELFFYYSGHGEFSNDEFYYLLSDFDTKKKNQTSLQNTEIDDLIKNLNPQIVIKLIDACQSGVSYIKESDVLKKYFVETKNVFNKCYFLNSSLSNQSSYQDDNLSFFTYSFVQSLKHYQSTDIRYKDIVDFISDEFQNNSDQTPFFVIQAEFTEKFCALNDDVKQYLVSYNTSNRVIAPEDKALSTLLSLVKAGAKEYVDKNGAIEAIKFFQSQLAHLSLGKELDDLYDVKVKFLANSNTLPNVKAIGKWLKDNNHDFFARPEYTEEYDEESGNEYTALSGYELLIDDIPFKAISVEIIRKFPNLKSYQCNIVFLVSRREISFFYVIIPYLEDGWDSMTLDREKIKWTYTTKKIAYQDSILEGLKSITEKINDVIKSDLTIQLGLQQEEDDLPF